MLGNFSLTARMLLMCLSNCIIFCKQNKNCIDTTSFNFKSICSGPNYNNYFDSQSKEIDSQREKKNNFANAVFAAVCAKL